MLKSKAKTRKRTRLIAIAVIVAAAALAAAAWLWDRDPTQRAKLGELLESGQAAGFNVLLVVLDTTRVDRLGCYGYERAQTPAIDGLVMRGVRFDDAVTSVPITLPSHATMFTGLHPPRHGVRDNGTHQLASEQVTLAETLKARGYDTAAFIGAFVLDRRYGLDQGFDVYDFEPSEAWDASEPAETSERPASAVTQATIRWLRSRQQSGASAPFFAWVHYFDPHLPYKSPLQDWPEFAGRPYEAEIAFVDMHLERLLAELDKHNLRDRTLIVLVSDHGEGLGEHGEPTHGWLLYGATMRVAFILSCPALFDGAYRVDDRVVGLVDLRPTVEDLLGVSPITPGDGDSLLRDEASPDRAVYIETRLPFYRARWSPLYGLRRHGDKYILAPEPEWYDLRKDPGELKNLCASSPPDLGLLREQLRDLMRSWEPDGQAWESTRSMSGEEVRRLASIGYVHVGQGSGSAGKLPDPKVMMATFHKVFEAQDLHLAGRSEEALTLARAALGGCDTFVVGSLILARICLDLGRLQEAAEVLQRSFDANPRLEAVIALVEILLALERYEQAVQVIGVAEAKFPENGRILLLRGDYLARRHRYEEAVAQYKRALHSDEDVVGDEARERITRAGKRMRPHEARVRVGAETL